MATKATFRADQVQAAIDHVIINGARNNGSLIHYSLVFDAAGLAAPQVLHQGGDTHLVSAFMEAFHRRCDELNLPPLDSLVVHVAGGRQGHPGSGYFRVNGMRDPFSERTSEEQVIQAMQMWDRQVRDCAVWGTHNRRGRA